MPPRLKLQLPPPEPPRSYQAAGPEESRIRTHRHPPTERGRLQKKLDATVRKVARETPTSSRTTTASAATTTTTPKPAPAPARGTRRPGTTTSPTSTSSSRTTLASNPRDNDDDETYPGRTAAVDDRHARDAALLAEQLDRELAAVEAEEATALRDLKRRVENLFRSDG